MTQQDYSKRNWPWGLYVGGLTCHWLHFCRCCITTGLILTTLHAAASDVHIAIQDDASYHVHPVNERLSIAVRANYSGSGFVSYQWQDFQDKPLTEYSRLEADKWKTIESPRAKRGYYGLVFKTSDDNLILPQRNRGETREYGFAILPPRSVSHRRLNPDSAFGMIHADIQDPYLIGWTKTTTWENARSSIQPDVVDKDAWLSMMDERRDAGLHELPLAVGDPWESDDTKPVSLEQLSTIQAVATQYFEADASVLYWEFGLEENLSSSYNDPYYWNNLYKKIKVVREAADQVNPEIKLIYQVVKGNPAHIEKFLQSDAASVYEILSLHAYEWPDFPSPDEWMAGYLNTVSLAMKENGVDMPIWFTEVGAPHHGNFPGGFFGYPSTGAEVEGLSRREAAAYMIKIHVLALQMGVQKVFWYNYRDGAPEREYPENHFGLRDYWGYPKPVYPAYFNMFSYIGVKDIAGMRELAGGVKVYEFDGTKGLIVAWTHPARKQHVSWSDLRPGLARAEIVRIVNPVGTPLPVRNNGICISGEPTFIIIRDEQAMEDALTSPQKSKMESR